MPTFAIFRNEPDIRSFRQGETIFKEGDPADCMFAVVEGAVEIELRSSVVEHIAPVVFSAKWPSSMLCRAAPQRWLPPIATSL